MLLLIGLTLVLLAGLVTWPMYKRDRARAMAWTPFGPKRARWDGEETIGDVRLAFGHTPFGATKFLIRCAAPLGDQLVCKLENIDRIMGPNPVVAPVASGLSAFDARYAVFIESQHDVAGTYRKSPGRATAWLQPGILQALLSLDMGWLRVHDGCLEAAFPLPTVKDEHGENKVPSGHVTRIFTVIVEIVGPPERPPVRRLRPVLAWHLGFIVGVPVAISSSCIAEFGCGGAELDRALFGGNVLVFGVVTFLAGVLIGLQRIRANKRGRA